MTAGDVWRSFGRWRHRRPFWGCFFFLLSGVELFFTANQSLGGISLHLGPTGFLSYVLPLIMVICGVLCLVTPAQRLFYGIVGLLAALYSFIGLNLGGFFLGMLFGIIGGALVIAWGPPRVKRADPVDPEFVPIADQLEEAAATDASSEASEDADEAENVEIAGHDDRPTEERVRPAAAQEAGIVPGFTDDQESPKSSRLPRNPKALTVALIVIGLTAGLLAVGSRVPASADDACPAGLPSRTATATATSTTAAAEKAAAGTARKPAAIATSAAAGAARKEPAKTSTEVSPSASPSKSGSGNSIVDGVKGIIDGVGNLLGLGDDPSSSPSASPSPSETPTTTEPTTTGAPDPTKTAGPTSTATSTATDEPSKTPSASASSDDVIPCLGARVFGLNAGADDVPLVADQPGLLETASLTMYDPTYDGVVNLKTGSGKTVRALKFSMSKAVNKPFSLTIAGPDSSHTVITSNELATIGTVKFYTQRFEGKLFGVIPVVFTPDQPPPLTLPILWFTDAKIQLNYVRCDTLTGVPLHISQKD